MTDFIQYTRLENGLTLITEKMPSLGSATMGIWVRRGSRHESPEMNGICHFIEHTVFKGTNRRSALDIAIESDRMGGHFDAFTTHEMTGFTSKVADKSIGQAFDLLADMIANPRFDDEDLRREQRVIIEEMKMVEDTPDEYLGELFNAAYFPNHPLGLPIEGTEDKVSTFDRETTAAFHAQEYAPENLVIAAAGNVEHSYLLELASRSFSQPAGSSTRSIDPYGSPIPAAPILIERKAELEQAHLIIATPWPDARSEDRYAASLLGSILGGGSAFSDVGVFAIYAGTSPEHVNDVVDLSLEELRRIVAEGVTEEELRLVKDQSTSSILLGLESTSSRAGALARQEIIHGRRISPDEMIQRLEAVEIDDITRIAYERFKQQPLALGALGNLNGFKVDRSRLVV